MKYFGYLKNKEFDGLDIDKKLHRLEKKGLFTRYFTMAARKNGEPESPSTETLEPGKELILDLYSFLTHRYGDEIEALFTELHYRFNSAIFLNEETEIRKKAVSLYLELLEGPKHGKPELARPSRSPSGLWTLENVQGLELMDDLRNGLMDALSRISGLMESYLSGNTDYFSMALFEDHAVLEEMVTFESNLRMLLVLNERFGFEEYVIEADLPVVVPPGDGPPLPINLPKATGLLSDTEAITYLLKNTFGVKFPIEG